MVAHGKANPGKLTIASAGNGSLPHLAAELLKRETGIDALHVPYRGAAPAVNDLLGGQVDLMFGDGPVVLPQILGNLLVPVVLATRQAAPGVAGCSDVDRGRLPHRPVRELVWRAGAEGNTAPDCRRFDKAIAAGMTESED